MSIEIHISGNTSTDVLAEIVNLAAAIQRTPGHALTSGSVGETGHAEPTGGSANIENPAPEKAEPEKPKQTRRKKTDTAEAPVDDSATMPLLGADAETKGADVKADASAAKSDTKDEKPVEIDDLREAFAEFTSEHAKGTEIAFGFLQDFGAKKLSDLDAGQRVEMLNKIKTYKA